MRRVHNLVISRVCSRRPEEADGHSETLSASLPRRLPSPFPVGIKVTRLGFDSGVRLSILGNASVLRRLLSHGVQVQNKGNGLGSEHR